jgi:stage IV sporulation protein FA
MKQQGDAGEPPRGSAFVRLLRGLAMRTLWALALFGAAWGWLRHELPGGEPARRWLSVALHEEMDVEEMRAWYEATFAGSPAFLPLFRDKSPDDAQTVWGGSGTVPPVEGRMVRTFAQNGNGVRFAAPAASPVRAVYAGLVMQVVQSGDGFATILIRHPNHVVTVYGQVDTPTVRANDWVEAGQTIGRLASDEGGEAEAFLDFAVRQNGRTLDPAAVIPLD